MDGSTKVQTINTKDDGSDLLIPLIMLIVLILFLGFLIYLLVSSKFSQPSLVVDGQGNPSRVLTDSITLTCPTDQCGTNLLTGLKRCPPIGQKIDYYPNIEVCNSRNLCDNPLTPYAVLSDGSAISSGVCESSIDGTPAECPCQRVPTCQSYLTSMYQSTGGSGSQPLAGQRISFQQLPTKQPNGIPLSYTPGSEYCTIPLSWLPLAGCNFVSGGFTNDMNAEAVQECMDLGTACQAGTLALITSNSERLDIKNSQYGCVVGVKCPKGQLTVYDTKLGGIVCRNS